MCGSTIGYTSEHMSGRIYKHMLVNSKGIHFKSGGISCVAKIFLDEFCVGRQIELVEGEWVNTKIFSGYIFFYNFFWCIN